MRKELEEEYQKNKRAREALEYIIWLEENKYKEQTKPTWQTAVHIAHIALNHKA